MINAFVCGLCTACTAFNFIEGHYIIGILSAAAAIANGIVMYLG